MILKIGDGDKIHREQCLLASEGIFDYLSGYLCIWPSFYHHS